MAKKASKRRKASARPKAARPPWSSQSLFRKAELSNAPALQPFTCYETLMSAAVGKADAFADILKAVAVACGGERLVQASAAEQAVALRSGGADTVVLVAQIKGEARCREKVEADYDGVWERLLDVLRGTISVRSPDQLPGTLKTLRRVLARHGWSVCGPVKNRIETPNVDGYRDILLRLRAPDGLVCELQLHVHAMLLAKNKFHDRCERVRAMQAGIQRRLDAAATDEERAAVRLTPTEVALMVKLKDEMRKAYGEAWRPVAADKSPEMG